MEKFSSPYASTLVSEAVKAGLIKLQGPGSTPEGSKANAEADAAYLLQFIAKLTGKNFG